MVTSQLFDEVYKATRIEGAAAPFAILAYGICVQSCINVTITYEGVQPYMECHGDLVRRYLVKYWDEVGTKLVRSFTIAVRNLSKFLRNTIP